jgi:spore maturation protein SpmB
MSQQNKQNTVAAKKNIVEEFMIGCRKGFYIGAEQIAPAMVLGFVVIQFLQITGLLDILGRLVGPVMAVFGLPGEAIVSLIAAFFAKTAGAAAAATLYTNGVIDAVQATILMPATITMGTLVGHYVRIVVVSDTNKKWHPLLLAIPIIDAAIVMLLTRLVLSFVA